MRFAAKEAIVKTMGGFSHGVWIRDVGVVQNAWGKPKWFLGAWRRLRRQLGIGEDVTLTDEEGPVSWRSC
jgi:phosphopantetheinyl transferase (holo-ACP synthase)